jgi:peptidoglycan hydrolase-like protein with peptidoglycan-binding domain
MRLNGAISKLMLLTSVASFVLPTLALPVSANQVDISANPPAVTVTEVVANQNQIPMLAPTSDLALKAIEQRYADIVARGGFPKVNGSASKGSTGDNIVRLNQRLYMDGYLRVEATQGVYAPIFTTATQDAVSRFQRNMGIKVTGKLDSATIAELNVPADVRLAAIRANIPRLEVYEKDLGDRYLVVNIPAQQIEAVSQGRVFSRHNAIVGRPERPSPVVMTPLKLVRFNPYWNAPDSIVEKDIIPKMVSGPQILKDMNIKVFQGKGANGPEINPATVNWSHAIPDNYLFRQEPGPKNAMATAKIEFNSPFGIYLHDTPDKEYFNTSNRFYSSGCIRVQNMSLLVQWVLNGQDGFDEAKIADMAKTLERFDETIVNPPQLRVVYMTAWPVAGGTVAFRKDIYQMDGSGFVVGQPMPVGEMSPDGQRFVLKPLPRQIPVEDAEAEGFHFFGSNKSSSKGGLFSSNQPSKGLFGSSNSQNTGNAGVVVSNPSGKKSPGLFDWATYRKQQAGGTQADVAKADVKKLKKVKLGSADVQSASATDNSAALEKLIKIPPKPKAVKAKKPVVDCKADPSAKDCKPADVTPTAADAPATPATPEAPKT